MHIKYQNVNDAFRRSVDMFQTQIVRGLDQIPYGGVELIRESSRNGDVLRIGEPVTFTYEKPLERVLFNAARDCNPVFHVFESLWMIAGRNDLAPLQYYVSTFGNYSDDKKTLNGAYGYRWRNARGHYQQLSDEQCKGWQVPIGTIAEDATHRTDQLQVLIAHLRKYPDSRRAVLQMWNVADDLLKIDHSSDCCCNLSVKFSMRNTEVDMLRFKDEVLTGTVPVLDMTVFNRSNDMILGALGANYVHFSFLQEYMAAHLGIGVGRYHQISDNMHVYLNGFKPEEWLAPQDEPSYSMELDLMPLVADPVLFDKEVKRFIDNPEGVYEEPFLKYVASNMCLAFRHHKNRDYVRAMEAADQIESDDWRYVCRVWLRKRQAMWENKNAANPN